MSLILVTGQSGTGKSTLLNEFKQQGYCALGIDENGIARHRFKSTKRWLKDEHYNNSEKHGIDWLRDVDYKIQVERVNELKTESMNKDIFVFGGGDDISDYYSEFNKIFALVVDEETLKHRLATRQGNEWGKKPHELRHILERFKVAETQYIQSGAIIVDSSRSVKEIVRYIVEKL